VIVHLDEELALEQITCRADDLAMLLTFNSTFSARQFYDKVTNEPAKDVLLSGGIEWGCPDPKTGAPTAILRRLEKASLEGASVLALTSPASHQVRHSLACLTSSALHPRLRDRVRVRVMVGE
jgi:hypothetical protein